MIYGENYRRIFERNFERNSGNKIAIKSYRKTCQKSVYVFFFWEYPDNCLFYYLEIEKDTSVITGHIFFRFSEVVPPIHSGQIFFQE